MTLNEEINKVFNEARKRVYYRREHKNLEKTQSDVLGVVAKTEAEHRESLKKIAKLFDNEELDQLYALEQENRELNNDLAGYKTTEAERTKKLQGILNTEEDQWLRAYPLNVPFDHNVKALVTKIFYQLREALLGTASCGQEGLGQQQEQKQP